MNTKQVNFTCCRCVVYSARPTLLPILRTPYSFDYRDDDSAKLSTLDLLAQRPLASNETVTHCTNAQKLKGLKALLLIQRPSESKQTKQDQLNLDEFGTLIAGCHLNL